MACNWRACVLIDMTVANVASSGQREPAEEEEGQFWWDMNVNGVDGVDGDALWEKSAPKRKSGSWEEDDFTWWWS